MKFIKIPEIEIINQLPTLEEYNFLRSSAGWQLSEKKATNKGIKASLFSLLAKTDEKTVAMGRVVGDGGIYFLIVDIIVVPEYQGMGIGTEIVRRLLEWIHSDAPLDSFIWLFAAEGREGFYERLGFARRPAPGRGAGMHWTGR